MNENNIKIAKARKKDIGEIMRIIKDAQKDFKKQGIDQWQNNYPNHRVIEKDIENNYSYLLKKEGKILGTTAIIFDKEETYDVIYQGEWLSNGEYAVIHRIAIDINYRGTGLASGFLNEIEKLCMKNKVYSIKIDTHRDNIAMKKLLLKNGYKECGIIYLKDKSERIAYEKLL